MKKFFKRVLCAVFAMALVGALVVGMVGCGEAKQTIAVVAKGETHAFWQSVKNGAQAAGEIRLCDHIPRAYGRVGRACKHSA